MEVNVAFTRHFLLKIVIFATFCLCVRLENSDDESDSFVYKAGKEQNLKFEPAKSMRYLLYEVNPGEGFNLRRDVYMRIANLVKSLNEIEPWTLVLPPWGRIYHWKSPIHQIKIRWSQFFDLDSLKKHIPVIEFEEFKKLNGPIIDELLYLQNYKEGWDSSGWKEKMDFRDCNSPPRFHQNEETGNWKGWFWDYDDVETKKFNCVSVQGHAGSTIPYLTKTTHARSVMIDRAETLLHDVYGQSDYWNARRSMVFARQLREVGDKFRAEYLESTDKADKTIYEDDWRNMRREDRKALGGPYIAVHLRRLDFLHSRKKTTPTLEGAAENIRKLLKKFRLRTVFVATDAPDDEYGQLKWLLKDFKVEKFRPSEEELLKYQDGGIAIIDQWICAHARYFIGSHESTFSFRIQEEREILGFKPETSFNRFCGENEKNCEQPSRWEIVY